MNADAGHISEDFPARGFVLCGDCDRPLTACWSKGKKQKHPYYLCHNTRCVSSGKSIQRDKIEGGLEDILRSMQPTPLLFNIARTMFKSAWDQRSAQIQAIRSDLLRSQAKIEKQIEQYLDRLVEASSPSVVKAYEKRIEALETKRIWHDEKLAQIDKPAHSFETMFEHACTFLENPWKLWASGNLVWKRIVLRLAFAERIPYDRNQGFRTPKLSLPFKMLAQLKKEKNQMVRAVGVEPTLCHQNWILSPARLPIPPRPQIQTHDRDKHLRLAGQGSMSATRPRWRSARPRAALPQTMRPPISMDHESSDLKRSRSRRFGSLIH